MIASEDESRTNIWPHDLLTDCQFTSCLFGIDPNCFYHAIFSQSMCVTLILCLDDQNRSVMLLQLHDDTLYQVFFALNCLIAFN